MAEPKLLYDNDFLAWSKHQAEALRAAMRDGSNQNLDFGNLAEEELDCDVERQTQRGIDLVLRDIGRSQEVYAETIAALWATSYTVAQVLGDWFPGEPPR